MSTHDAFISYSHAADERLAPAIESGLERLGRSWTQRRALDVFRDQTSLAANPGLWSEIEKALDGSRYFILMAAPEAAASPWVQKEIDWWIRSGRRQQFLIAMTDGDIAWDDAGGDFDWERTTALPQTIAGHFSEEPLYVDLRWARSDTDVSLRHSRFRSAVAELAAPIHGVAKEDLESEDIRRHRRARRLARLAVVALTVLALAAASLGGVALVQRNEAVRQTEEAVAARDEAEEQRAIAEAETARATEQARIARSREVSAQAELLDREPDLALLLHVGALHLDDSLPNERSLLRSLNRTGLDRYLRLPVDLQSSLTGHAQIVGDLVVVTGDDGVIAGYDLATGDLRASLLSGYQSPTEFGLVPTDEAAATFIADPIVELRRVGASDVIVRTALGNVTSWNVADGTTTAMTSECFFLQGGAGIAASDVTLGLACSALPGVRETDVVYVAGPDGFVEIPVSESIAGIAAAPDGKSVLVATTGTGTGVELRGLGAEVLAQRELPTEHLIFSAAFSPDGSLVAVGSFDGTMAVLDASDLAEVTRVAGHSSQVTLLEWHEETTLISGDAGGTVIEWQWDDRSAIEERRLVGHADDIEDVELRDDDLILATATALSYWSDGTQVRSGLDSDVRAFAVAELADGSLVATAEADGVFDVTPGSDGRRVLPASDSGPWWKLATGGDRLAAATFAGTVMVVDTTSGAEVFHLDRDEVVWDLDLSADGSTVAMTSFTAGVEVFDALSAEPAMEPVGGGQGIQAVALHPSGDRVAYGSGTELRVRTVATGHEATGRAPFGASVIAFSPDGDLVALGDLQGGVRIFDTETLDTIAVFGEPTNQVSSIAFSGDGNTLAAGTSDGLVYLWDVPTAERIEVIGSRASFHTISDVTFTADGRLITATPGGPVLWDLRREGLAHLACDIAGRTLTTDEWARYFPDEEYFDVCA